MPALNPTIQLVVVYHYTKYEHFILNGSGDIFDEKALQNYGWTDGQMEGRTDVNQYNFHCFKGGYKYIIINLHTKYDCFGLHSFTEIFDKKFHYSKIGKKIGQIQGRISRRRLVRNPKIKYCLPNTTTPACTISQKSLTKNFINSKYGKKVNWTNTGKK